VGFCVHYYFLDVKKLTDHWNLEDQKSGSGMGGEQGAHLLVKLRVTPTHLRAWGKDRI
jgi:hypothetical protein